MGRTKSIAASETRPKSSSRPSCCSLRRRVLRPTIRFHSLHHHNATIPLHKYPFRNAAQAGMANLYTGRRTIHVPCGPLTPLLFDFAWRARPFLLSLDVEGAESLVLQHMHFTSALEWTHCLWKWRIHIALPRNFCTSRHQTRIILANKGYQRLETLVIASDVYVHPQSPF